MPHTSADRICLVGPRAPANGDSLHLESLARKLASEGASVWLLSYDSVIPANLSLAERIPGFRALCGFLSYLIGLARVMPRIDTFYQIVGCGSQLYAFMLVLLSKCFRKRVVISCLAGSGWTDQCKKKKAKFFNWCDQVIVPSDNMQATFQMAGIKAEVIPATIDAQLFSFIGRNLLRPKFLVTRKLEKAHSIDAILRAYAKVQAVCRSSELAIAGSGPESDRLKDLARILRLRGVRFLGAVPYEELPRVFSKYDIFVNAAEDEDFPGALLQAACCGLPIVTAESGPILEMMTAGCSGISVPAGDELALAGAMLEALVRQHYALRLAYNARKWVENFDPSVTYEGLRRVLFPPEARPEGSSQSPAPDEVCDSA